MNKKVAGLTILNAAGRPMRGTLDTDVFINLWKEWTTAFLYRTDPCAKDGRALMEHSDVDGGDVLGIRSEAVGRNYPFLSTDSEAPESVWAVIGSPC